MVRIGPTQTHSLKEIEDEDEEVTSPVPEDNNNNTHITHANTRTCTSWFQDMTQRKKKTHEKQGEHTDFSERAIQYEAGYQDATTHMTSPVDLAT